MQCLWPSTRDRIVEKIGKAMVAGRTAAAGRLALVLLVIVVTGVVAWCCTAGPQRINSGRIALAHAERGLRSVPAHISEFGPFAAPLALPKCESVRPPEALLTPDPLLSAEDENLFVGVSFIVGTDGRVHSAFVLNSGGAYEDQVVLRAVRQWRYRPALCNGVPTDSEARVRFSLQ
jgi:TonB family protein